MRRRVDDLRVEGEVAGSLVDVGKHRLVFLREQRHDVHLAVPVQIHWNGLDAAAAWIDRVRREHRLRRAGRAILENRHLPGPAPPERCDGEVVLAVPVEVGQVDRGHSGPPIQPERAEFASGKTAQPDDRAFGVIRGKELAHVGDEQVPGTVAIHVAQRDVSRVRDAGDNRERAARAGRTPHEYHALPHVGTEHVEPCVTVEVHELDVRHGWRARHVRHVQTGSHEANR
jgi:hypothetical protein